MILAIILTWAALNVGFVCGLAWSGIAQANRKADEEGMPTEHNSV